MIYKAIRTILFKFDPELIHNFTLASLAIAERFRLISLVRGPLPSAPVEVMGLRFPNPIGLAAGMDKDGVCIDGLGALGFGFLELGTVTPRAQQGNPKPRLFRIPQKEAIINRMGFNNLGIDQLLSKVSHHKYKGIIGINIGKNFDTPLEKALDDYLIGLEKSYPYADYIAINISSPNTVGLRQLQKGEEFNRLLAGLKKKQLKLSKELGRYVPLAVKIAPDLQDDEIEAIAAAVESCEIDGVIATNTTLDRTGVDEYSISQESGGLSGRPLTDKSLQVFKTLRSALNPQIPIIASGGMMSPVDAMARLQAGASLIQLYTGFIYHGPSLIHNIINDYKELSR